MLDNVHARVVGVFQHHGTCARTTRDEVQLLQLIHRLADGEAVDAKVPGEGKFRGQLGTRGELSGEDLLFQTLGDIIG